jgi:hypothetical protein
MVRIILLAAAAALLFAAPAGATDPLSLLPGGSPSAKPSAGSPGFSYTAKPRYDRADRRRVPQFRHQAQMRRYWERRRAAAVQAARNLDAGITTLPSPGERQRLLIRPTVFSYSAALANVLRIAVGDRVIYRTSSRTGFLLLERIGANAAGETCRYYREEVRVPGGAEIGYGSACRMRDGQWRFHRGIGPGPTSGR